MPTKPRYTEPPINCYLHARALSGGIPLAGNFELTPCCNLCCRMCYVRKTPQQVQEAGGLLRKDAWLSLGEQAAKQGMLFLLLTGGEPLTHPDFCEIYTGLRRLGLMISINTNGTLLDEAMIDFFRADTPTRFNVTLYGASRATYERLCGNGAAFDRALAGIERLLEAGIGVKINLSITPDNCDDVPGIFAIADRLGVQIQSSCYMLPPIRRSAEFAAGVRFTPEEAAQQQVLCDRLRLGEAQLAQRAAAIAVGAGDAPTPDIVRCRAGSTAFWVTWDGWMLPCGMMTQPAVSVLNQSFYATWQQIRAATAQIHTPAACTTCDMRHACSVCAASCLAETGAFDGVPTYVCELTQQTIALTCAKEGDQL